MPLAARVRDPAQHLVLVDQVHRVPVSGVAAALVADLDQLAGLPGREHDLLAALDRVGHLLLAVHVLARLQTGDRLLRVHPVGRGDDDRVRVRVFGEHFLVVGIDGDLLVVRLEDAPRIALAVAPDIARGHEPNAGDLHAVLEQVAALAPRADYAHAQLIGLRPGFLAKRRLGQHQAGPGGRGGLKKAASGHFGFRAGFVFQAHRRVCSPLSFTCRSSPMRAQDLLLGVPDMGS